MSNQSRAWVLAATTAAVLTFVATSQPLAQVELLPLHDFEAGLAPWTSSDGSISKWHLAPDGECGAITSVAAFNQGPACGYPTAAVLNVSHLISPDFFLAASQNDTVHLSFDYRRELEPGESSEVYLRSNSGREKFTLADDLANTATVQHVVLPLPSHPTWNNIHAEIHFMVATNNQGNTGFGVQVDNVRIRRTWTDIAHGLAGVGPPPRLSGQGPLEPGSANALLLLAPEASATAWVVVGLEQGLAPFKGGTLVPTPDFVLPAATPHTGQLTIPFILPRVPSGLSLIIQCWVPDPFASFGWAASNALVGVTA